MDLYYLYIKLSYSLYTYVTVVTFTQNCHNYFCMNIIKLLPILRLCLIFNLLSVCVYFGRGSRETDGSGIATHNLATHQLEYSQRPEEEADSVQHDQSCLLIPRLATSKSLIGVGPAGNNHYYEIMGCILVIQ